MTPENKDVAGLLPSSEGARDASGYTWLGMRAAGWLWTEPSRAYQGATGYPIRHYASHWSTGPKDAERLYRESDIRKLLAEPGAAIAAREQEAVFNADDAKQRGIEYFAERYPALKEALAAEKNAVVTAEMIAAGLKAANALDPVLSTLYPNELTAVYQAMHALRPFAQPAECTTCGALVVGVASRPEAPVASAPGAQQAASEAAPGDSIKKYRLTWQEAEAICVRDEVDEALREFVHDSTGDNANGLARCIVEAYLRHPPLASREEAPVASNDAIQLPHGALSTLRNVIETLRSDGTYVDEEGEPTDALDDLYEWLLKLASPSGAGLGGAVSSSEAVDWMTRTSDYSEGYRHGYAKGLVDDREYTYRIGRMGGISRPEMHPATADLVMRFGDALRDKLAAAEKKYGYSDGWLSSDWMDECRTQLLEHVAKGDPRDVAAYCAFLWHHGESTAAPRAALASQPGCAVEGEAVDPIDAELALPPAVEWPKTRDVGRLEDMSPDGVMRVSFDGDNDVSVGVYDERGSAVVEFCTPGSGGGKSSRTRRALIALMVAMEADNAEDPGRDWWAIRAQQGAALQVNSTEMSEGAKGSLTDGKEAL